MALRLGRSEVEGVTGGVALGLGRSEVEGVTGGVALGLGRSEVEGVTGGGLSPAKWVEALESPVELAELNS